MRTAVLILLCVMLTSCGVKPKRLESAPGFPATYPQE